MDKKNARFASRWGFILSAVGSAVGMANVWGFPAKMGANGGGAFLVAYLNFIAFFSVVGLSAEYAIGRRARTGTLGAYRKAWESRSPKLGNAGGLVGWLPLAGSMCIAIGYAVIISYVLKALFQSVTGELMQVDRCMVRRFLFQKIFCDSLPCDYCGGHSADSAFWRKEHRKKQQTYDACVLRHFCGAGNSCGISARRSRGLQVYVLRRLEQAERPHGVGLGYGTGVFLTGCYR